MQCVDLMCRNEKDPLGIDDRTPRLSWRFHPDRRGASQSAYQIQVDSNPSFDLPSERLIWDTGKVVSGDSLHHLYQGAPLQTCQRYYWRVRAWDEAGQGGPWSDAAWWEMGLLDPVEWRAVWIEPETEIDPLAFKPCPYLRRSFILGPAPLERARIYVTSHGVYELSLNGRIVGDQVLPPGFTSYHRRLQYQTYDVTDPLREGENVVGVILGDGWYRGKTDALSFRNLYGQAVGLLLQLHIIDAQRRELWVGTDGEWRTATGPLLKSDLKDGEIYDARLEMRGWNEPGFDAGSWRPVRVVEHPKDNLVAQAGPPIRRHETFTPAILKTPDGGTVLDMGQNMAGRVRMRVRGPAGATVVVRRGETLDEQGNFTMKNLNVSQLLHKLFKLDVLLQEDRYTLRGGETETYEPRFTYHGFRYVRVDGYPGEPRAEDFLGIALYSDMRMTGSFECSDPLLNRLHRNIEWSMKSNFVDIPTDCPQRERSGWTGDAQVFARTASFLMETLPFFRKWLRDLSADQRPDGMVPNVVPDPSLHTDAGIIGRTNGSAGWSDAAVTIPWVLYECSGDRGILEEQYASMKAWVSFVEERSRASHWSRWLNPLRWADRHGDEAFLCDTGYHWGEWQEPDLNPFIQMLYNFVFSRPDVATAFHAFTTRLLARAAEILGHAEDARHFGERSEAVRRAWARAFVRPDGRIRPDRQASYVRALAFDLLPPEARAGAAKRLVELLRKADYHLSTGFLSTPFLCPVLSRFGYEDVAYRILMQRTPPSWLYPVTRGATTVWEFWEAIRQDGTVGMGSHNHYSPGSVGSWLFDTVCGIQTEPDIPGYKAIRISPRPGGGLTRACATYRSPYGDIESSWEIRDGRIRLDVRVPPNTTAIVQLPGAAAENVTEGGVPLASVAGVHDLRRRGSDLVFNVGSGVYQIEYPRIASARADP